MGRKLKSILVLEADADNLLNDIASSQYSEATVIQSDSVAEAQKLIKKKKPDLALIDLGIVDGEIPEVIKSIRADSPETTCIVASNIEDDTEIFLALKAGAKGYLLKDKEEDQISKHLDNILDGQPTVAPTIAYQMLGYFHRQPNFDNDDKLSDRENVILTLIASGKKRTEVAEQLNISMNTVATHLKNIYSKLKINSRAEATVEALRRGLIKS